MSITNTVRYLCLYTYSLTDDFNAKDEFLCDCPVPCQRKMYETTISYAETSKFDTRRHQRASNTKSLQVMVVIIIKCYGKQFSSKSVLEIFIIHWPCRGVQALKVIECPPSQIKSKYRAYFCEETSVHLIHTKRKRHVNKYLNDCTFFPTHWILMAFSF